MHSGFTKTIEIHYKDNMPSSLPDIHQGSSKWHLIFVVFLDSTTTAVNFCEGYKTTALETGFEKSFFNAFLPIVIL